MRNLYILLIGAALLLIAAGLATGITYPAQVIFFALASSFCLVMGKGLFEAMHEERK